MGWVVTYRGRKVALVSIDLFMVPGAGGNTAGPDGMLRVVTGALEMEGHHVVSASNGMEAMERLEKDQPDLVRLLLDHGADIDGLDEYGQPPVVRFIGTQHWDTALLLVVRGARLRQARGGDEEGSEVQARVPRGPCCAGPALARGPGFRRGRDRVHGGPRERPGQHGRGCGRPAPACAGNTALH